MQDAIKVEQASAGKFEVPNWDQASLTKARDALETLGSLGGTVERFGKKQEVDPFDHLIGTAIGWGGNPRHAADYQSFYPPKNDGKTAYRLTLRDVPVDGFWSISVYNAKGFFEKNALNAYSLNNLTAKPDPGGGTTIQFGGCGKQTPNCLPIVKGWSYTMRLYRPRKEILDGSWKLPRRSRCRDEAERRLDLAGSSVANIAVLATVAESAPFISLIVEARVLQWRTQMGRLSRPSLDPSPGAGGHGARTNPLMTRSIHLSSLQTKIDVSCCRRSPPWSAAARWPRCHTLPKPRMRANCRRPSER